MKLAINQPYFFPYLGYFSLIRQTDRFILLDEIQYIKQGWINRNRILASDGGWQYIRVPMAKFHQTDLISQVKISDKEDWREEILNRLLVYKGHGPYFRETMETVGKALSLDTDNITRLNEHALKAVCDHIGIASELRIFSDLELKVQKAEAPDEVPLNICRALGNIEEYWNLEGGAEFYDRSKFDREGIGIKFVKMNLQQYPQIHENFEPALSILDVMMFNDPDQIQRMLDDYQLL